MYCILVGSILGLQFLDRLLDISLGLLPVLRNCLHFHALLLRLRRVVQYGCTQSYGHAPKRETISLRSTVSCISLETASVGFVAGTCWSGAAFAGRFRRGLHSKLASCATTALVYLPSRSFLPYLCTCVSGSAV